MEEEKNILKEVKKESEKAIEALIEQGINEQNLDYLYKVVKIHKNIANEEHWEKEEEKMRYRAGGNYGEYGEYGDDSYGRRGRGRNASRDSRGRYTDGGSYGRRGVEGTGRGRYRGEEMMDEMMYHYGNYSEGREQYGADQETMESFKYMLKSFKDYYKHLKQEASSQQEVKMLEDVAREISEM